jgi:hypothetical protein
MSVHGESPAQGYPAPAQRVATVWEAIRVKTEEILAGVTIADLLTDDPSESAAVLLMLREHADV